MCKAWPLSLTNTEYIDRILGAFSVRTKQCINKNYKEKELETLFPKVKCWGKFYLSDNMLLSLPGSVRESRSHIAPGKSESFLIKLNLFPPLHICPFTLPMSNYYLSHTKVVQFLFVSSKIF